MREEMGLAFVNLIDPESKTIKAYGLLNEEHGSLPHPATIVVDRAGTILFFEYDEDYTHRPSTKAVLEALQKAGRGSLGSGTLIVLNKAEATASLIDLGTHEVVATVPTGSGPHEVAVSPDGRLAVATNYGRKGEAGSSLTVIDVASARVVSTIDLGNYRRPHGIEWLADGRHVVVTAEENRALLTVDITTGKVVSAIDTGESISHMVVVTPDGSRAFVANIGSGSITAIDLSRKERIRSIPTGDGAEGITITPDGSEVWITNREADSVTILDASSLEILVELKSASFPIRARATPDGKYVLVSNARSGDVAVFDVATRKEVRRLSMDLSAVGTGGRLFEDFGKSSVPIGILIPPDGKRAYVAHTNSDVVSVIDLSTWKVVGILEPGKEPDGLGYSRLTIVEGGGRG